MFVYMFVCLTLCFSVCESVCCVCVCSRFKNVLFEISSTESSGAFQVNAKFMGVNMDKVELLFQVTEYCSEYFAPHYFTECYAPLPATCHKLVSTEHTHLDRQVYMLVEPYIR